MKDKVCIVTGGARGIGREIVEQFVKAGAKKVYACDVNIEPLSDLKSDAVVPFELDVTNTGGVEKLADTIMKNEGRIDVLVNNAGITRDGLLANISDDEWDLVVGINLKGVFNMTRVIAPLMIELNSGCVVNMASVVGMDGNIGQTNYAATKAGVIGMTKTWAKEFARKGAQVRCNAVAPGFIATPMTEKVPQKILDAMISKTPLARMGSSLDVARAVVFLSSENASFITGQVLRVDGGLVF